MDASSYSDEPAGVSRQVAGGNVTGKELSDSPRSQEGDLSGREDPDDVARIVRSISDRFRMNQLPLMQIALGVLLVLIAYVFFLLLFVRGLAPGQCGSTVCPKDWAYGASGGYFCEENKGCRPADQGPFPICENQCWIGNVPTKHIQRAERAERTTKKESTIPKPGYYDLRLTRHGKMVGCMAPISKFPGDPRYGCGPPFDTARSCDAAPNPIRETQYVAAVHRGCATEMGKGTYGYAFDDGIGLKQCPPMTLYEWILCPTGNEEGFAWSADDGPRDSKKRFRVTNHCSTAIWIQSAGQQLPFDPALVKIEPGGSYSYAVPKEGVPSTRFLPKTGCDETGNNCDVQSVPPCPAEGCSPPIDTKFEASFGCLVEAENRSQCAKTGQGLPYLGRSGSRGPPTRTGGMVVLWTAGPCPSQSM